MPSSHPTIGRSRRRVLAALGTAVAGGLAGCAGRVPVTGPERINAESTVENDRVLWRYPPRNDDREGIGYAAVEAERRTQRGEASPVLWLQFNSTIGRLAAGEPYKGYRLDWFRFRIWPSTTYGKHLQYHVRVEPPGQWEDFSAYYDVRGGVRRFGVELRNVDTQGTIIVPAVFDAGVGPLPEKLHCSFTVQASRPGLLGETVRVDGRETLRIERE